MARAEKYPNVNAANRYARDVVSGRIKSCSWVRYACQRHLNDLEKSKKRNYPFKFDKEAGERICVFGQRLVHVKGKWSRQFIQLEPWQKFLLVTLFGWLRKSDGFRRFRQVYWEIPRKNGKSVLGAIIGLYMLVADGEEGAEVYSGATTEKQAWEVFRPAKLMAERSPHFKKFWGVNTSAQSIFSVGTGSRFEPIIGNPGDGPSPHCAIVDEYHEHRTAALYDTMETGMGARTQPLLVVITTAGTNLAGPCYQKHHEARKVLLGVLGNDELHTIIYTLDVDDKRKDLSADAIHDWTDLDTWAIANPNAGISVLNDFIAARHRDATQLAEKQNIIRCKNLNIWSQAHMAWMNMVKWNSCADPKLAIENFDGEECYAALDLASKTDLAVLTALFKQEQDEKEHWYSFNRYYLPSDTVNMSENTHYQTWEHAGLLTVTEGAIIDYAFIEEDLKQFARQFLVKEVAYDPYHATQFATRMMAENIPMVEYPQTVKNMSEPMKEVEAVVLDGRFHHDGDPIYSWMASNVVAHEDAKSNIFPRKEQNKNKIDGMVTTIMAIGRATAGDEEEQPKKHSQPVVDLWGDF